MAHFHLDKALDLNPLLDEAYVFKASICFILKENLEAKECIKKALALNPDKNADTHSILG